MSSTKPTPDIMTVLSLMPVSVLWSREVVVTEEGTFGVREIEREGEREIAMGNG